MKHSQNFQELPADILFGISEYISLDDLKALNSIPEIEEMAPVFESLYKRKCDEEDKEKKTFLKAISTRLIEEIRENFFSYGLYHIEFDDEFEFVGEIENDDISFFTPKDRRRFYVEAVRAYNDIHHPLYSMPLGLRANVM